MAPKYTEEELEEFRDVFASIDKDNSGTITLEELKSAMHRLDRNPSDKELQQILKEVDLNGSGVIEFTEFLGVLALNPPDPDKELLEMFKGFDQNEDGFVTHDELKRVMLSIGERLTDEEINAMIKESDIDNDGRVNYEEFVKMMRSM